MENFQETNRKTRISMMQTQAQLQAKLVEAEARVVSAKSLRRDLVNRERLLRSFSRGPGGGGSAGSGGAAALDPEAADAQLVSEEQREPLAAGLDVSCQMLDALSQADLWRLALNGEFSGLREIHSVSNRSLADVTSGIKDISSVCSGVDGLLLERLVETNIKVLTLINGFCAKKVAYLDAEWERVGREIEDSLRADGSLRAGGRRGSSAGTPRGSVRGGSGSDRGSVRSVGGGTPRGRRRSLDGLEEGLFNKSAVMI